MGKYCLAFKGRSVHSRTPRIRRIHLVSRNLAAAAGVVISLVLAGTGVAYEDSLEKDLQKSLADSRTAVLAADGKVTKGASVSDEIRKLTILADSVRITTLLLEERFRIAEQKAGALRSKALDRQQTMSDAYRKAISEYLAIIDSMQEPGAGSQENIKKLKALLDTIIPKKKLPIIGSLPYKHLNLPSREPSASPEVAPAYHGGNKTVSSEDTATTDEAPVSKEIATLAQSLNWNPVSIYEYVKNNVETEWYWGCMKGAPETLRQKSGNDCDQATLLAALFRASGFPTRYVRGTIEFLPDIDRVKNLTGIEEPLKIAEFFQKAGIPYKPVIAGGGIANFQIEHIWIESRIPYANYRGALIDEHGKTWLGLDTSIKVKGYEYGAAKDVFQEPEVMSQLESLRDEYLSSLQPLTPLEYLYNKIDNSALHIPHSEFQQTRTQIPEVMNILPAGMQFKEIRITNEYTVIPDELKHKVRIIALSAPGNAELLNSELTVMQLGNERVILSYEPESVEDQEIINSYGGLDNTPAYLVRLRPVIKVNGERIAVGVDGLPMGSRLLLTLELTGPFGGKSPEKVVNELIVGNLAALGIVAGKAIAPPSPLAGEACTEPAECGGGEGARTAEELLFNEALRYIDQWNKSEEELASLFHLSMARPLPTVVTIAGLIDVTYLLDMPHGFTWKGVYLDADLRRIEALSRTPDPGDRTRLFMQLSSLQGSVLEHRLFEEDFKIESISTAKLFQLINGSGAQGPAAGNQLLLIDKDNIDADLLVLDVDDNIKEDIINSVNQNYSIRVPQSPLTYYDWTGTGYIKENRETGESGWMLSGMIAGGCPVKAEWVEQHFKDILSSQYTYSTNQDPLSAAWLMKVGSTDNQPAATVNTDLPKPLTVFVADAKGVPVKGAPVTFRLIAGGGKIQCLDQFGNPIGQPDESSCSHITAQSGFLKAVLTLGARTDTNPVFIKPDPADENYTQAGLNLVTASVTNHAGTITLTDPFVAHGKPDAPVKIEKVYPLKPVYAIVNNPAGSLYSRVTDTHGNSVSNVMLTIKAEEAESNNPDTDPLPDPGKYRDIQLYTHETCTNPYPLYSECTTTETLHVKTQYYGAQVETLLGDTLNTHYRVMVSAPTLTSVPSVSYDLYSKGERSRKGSYLPSILMLLGLGQVNEKGDPVNAAKVGEKLKAPLATKMFLLKDQLVDENQLTQEACKKQDSNGNTITYTGYSFVSKGTFTIMPVSGGTVTFETIQGGGTPDPVQEAGQGIYKALYRTGPVPAKNVIKADGSAQVTVPRIFGEYSSDGYAPKTTCLESSMVTSASVNLNHGQYALFSESTNELLPVYSATSKTTFEVYGVKADLEVVPNIIQLHDDGYIVTDATFSFSIQPPDYRALRADLDTLSTDVSNVTTTDGTVATSSPQGEGKVVFLSGMKFDISKLYETELVLNRGTDMEVRSDRMKIPIVQINVLTDEGGSSKKEDEIKFGDGSKPTKRYTVKLESAAFKQLCSSLTGTIRTILRTGATATNPGGAYYPVEYQLSFVNAVNGNGCDGKINSKEKFIVSNRSIDDLNHLGTVPQNTEVLYGGLGNKVQVEVSRTTSGGNNGATSGTTNKIARDIPIEPVGVIVLAIDGLRQDVLYAPTLSSTETVTASYSDPAGCGGSCYVDPKELKGLCDVLGGKYDDGFFGFFDSCNTIGWDKKHVKLPNVTAVFPSITLASWASIFTGKMPGKTGILGNEFFARDLNVSTVDQPSISVPPKMNNQPGIISLSSGAFEGYDEFGIFSGLFTKQFFIPYQFDWKKPVDPVLDPETGISTWKTPQNNRRVLLPDTVFESITGRADLPGSGMTAVINYFKQRGGDPVVVANNHYARGSYWLTWDMELKWGSSATLDHASWKKFNDYLGGKYQSLDENQQLVRNKTHFSALTVWYLPGPDHEAHIKGMGAYTDFIKKSTDVKIYDVVSKLKKLDDFDNKIFIVVADHGHTAMPEKFKYKVTTKTYDGSNTPIEITMEVNTEPSCKLNLEFGSADKADVTAQKEEQANNNLHIWELGEVMRAVGENGWGQYKVLAPREIAKLYKKIDKATNKAVEMPYGATATIEKADVMVGLNGPMAHVYLPDMNKLGKIAELFRLTLDDHPAEAAQWWNLDDLDYSDFRINTIGRLRMSVDKILVRGANSYCVFDGLNDDGSIRCTATDPFAVSAYVDAWTRINGMNNKDRSGDIVLIMRDAASGDAVDRYTSGVACKSWHGSLNPSDSYVPFIVSYPGGNKTEVENILQKGTLCKTDYSNCKGNWKLSDVVKEIVSEQYK